MNNTNERSVASAGSHWDARRDSFKAFVLEWTGRSLEQHHAAGTTGLEFAWACWLRGRRLTDEERFVLREVRDIYADEDDVKCNEIAAVLDGLLERTR